VQSKRFRDTLWFKKGAQDDRARQAEARGEAEPADVPDQLPVEDRYLDDGSITREDSLAFSVHTGRTQAVPRLTTTAPERKTSVPVDALVRELTWSRRQLAMIGASVAAIVALVAVLVR
jgi:hypothetical protein